MKRLVYLYAVAGLVVGLDRLSKWWATSNLVDSVEVVPGWLRFKLLYNPGAAFSFLTSATWLFTVVATAVVVAIVFFAPRIRHSGWAAAVGGILGGAAGNLIDRLTNPPAFGQGHVTDFIQVPAIPIFQTFNIADAALTLSVVALMVMSSQGRQLDGTLPASVSHE